TSIADLVPPQVTSTAPATGATGVAVNAQITVQFNEAMNAASISTSSIELRDAASNLVSATVSYNATTRVATLQPAANLATATVYTLIVKSGTAGVKDLAGNSLASTYVAYLTTVSGTISIFAPTAGPTQTGNDGSPLILGMKFRSSQAGQVVGVRFYKPAAATGV